MSNSINLTLEKKAYNGCYRRAEVMPFSYEPEPEFRSFEAPGVYLQFVEGCSYDVYSLTAVEAERLAEILLKAVAESRSEFKNK